MLYAIISDVHGNIEALKAVHQDIRRRGIDKVINLGDTVGYGPKPRQCLDYSREISDVTLQGNHDRAVVDDEYPGFHYYAEASGVWTRHVLGRKGWGSRSTTEYLDYLAGLPVSKNIDGVMLVAHDNLANPGNNDYMKENEAPDDIIFDTEGMLIDKSILELQKAGVSVGLFAHTHAPRVYAAREEDLYEHRGFDQEQDIYELGDGDIMMFNVGSVGQPRDKDPRACYVLVHCDDKKVKKVEYVRVEYKVKKTVSQLKWSFIDWFIKWRGPEKLKRSYKFYKKKYDTTIAKTLIDRLRLGK